jgi:peptidoglycan-associated lipoprotein
MFVTTLLLVAAFTADGCARRTATAPPPQPPPPFEQPAVVPPAPPAPIVDDRPTEPIIVPEEVSGRNIEDLNQDNPLKPAFFPLDSADLDDQARSVVAANADVLKRYPQWVISIEGHCDERGTTEYNLALGERRAMAAKNYLLSLGIPAERLRTVSYGDEYPFDRASTESAWSLNRRAHFVILSK